MGEILLFIVVLIVSAIVLIVKIALPIIAIIAGVLLIKYLYTKLKNEEDKRL